MPSCRCCKTQIGTGTDWPFCIGTAVALHVWYVAAVLFWHHFISSDVSAWPLCTALQCRCVLLLADLFFLGCVATNLHRHCSGVACFYLLLCSSRAVLPRLSHGTAVPLQSAPCCFILFGLRCHQFASALQWRCMLLFAPVFFSHCVATTFARHCSAAAICSLLLYSFWAVIWRVGVLAQ